MPTSGVRYCEPASSIPLPQRAARR